MLESVADVAHVDKTLLEQFVVDDEIPGGTGGQETLAIVGKGDAVAGGLVGMRGQEVRVKIGGVVLHRTGSLGLGGEGAGAVHSGGGTQYLVLGRNLLHLPLQAFVLRGGFLGSGLQGG